MVQRLEVEARQRPGHYRFKVALLAVLGFLVLGGSVLLAFGISIGLVAVLLMINPVLLLKLIKVVWIPIALGVLILSALWVRFSPPGGHRLRPDEAPLLQAEVERLRRGAGAPKLSGILIDTELNATAASVPRMLGLLGHQHYLVLGLPLMQALNREQFAAVVAHEFGHFGGGHGRFSGWIYRVRVSWYRVLDALSERRSWANGLFVRFFDWYAPYFDAYSFALARANEYQADATAARLVGAEAAGTALVQVNLAAERLERDFWPGLKRINGLQERPPERLYQKMFTSLRQRREVDAERLQSALDRKADIDDTHPSLAQRLSALGVAPGLPEPPQCSAADELLGEYGQMLERAFSEQWQELASPMWQENHEQHAADRKRLELLEQQTERTLDENIEYAGLIESVHPGRDVEPLYRAVLGQNSDHALAHFRLGLVLLEREQVEGAEHLWQAMALDRDATASALQVLESFYRRQADDAGLERVANTWKSLQRMQDRIRIEVTQLSTKDVFLPHDLDPDSLQALQAALQTQKKVGRAWLVRKQIPDTPDWPHFVLVVKWRGMVLDADKHLQALVNAQSLPGSMVVLSLNDNRPVTGRIRKMDGAEVYRRA